MTRSNAPGGEFELFVGYTGSPPASETGEIIAAIDAAFVEFAAERGRTDLRLEIVDFRMGSIRGILRIVGYVADIGGAIGTVNLAFDHSEFILQFLQDAAYGLQLALESGAVDRGLAGVRAARNRMLAALARPVADGRASKATLCGQGEDRPTLVIANDNAAPFVAAWNRVGGRGTASGIYTDDHGNTFVGEGAGAGIRRGRAAFPVGALGLTSGYLYPHDGISQPLTDEEHLRIVDPIDGAAPVFDADGLLAHTRGRWEVTLRGSDQPTMPLVNADRLQQQLDPEMWYDAHGTATIVDGSAPNFAAQMIRNRGERNADIAGDIRSYGLSIVDIEGDAVIVRNHRGKPDRIAIGGGYHSGIHMNVEDLVKTVPKNLARLRALLDANADKFAGRARIQISSSDL